MNRLKPPTQLIPQKSAQVEVSEKLRSVRPYAQAAGKARGASPEWKKLEMRPVALKRGIKLQAAPYIIITLDAFFQL